MEKDDLSERMTQGVKLISFVRLNRLKNMEDMAWPRGFQLGINCLSDAEFYENTSCAGASVDGEISQYLRV